MPSAVGFANLDFLDGYLHRVMTEMLKLEGADASGLYHFYQARVETNVSVLSGYDRILSEYIQQGFDRQSRRIVHAGIGLGTLTCALAIAGYTIVGIEQDSRRAQGARRVRAAVIEARGDVAERYDLLEGQYPAVLTGTPWLSPATLLIFTNCGAGWSDELTKNIIESFPRGGDVIFDTRLFGRVRETAEERQSLVAQIEAQGFVVTALGNKPGDGFYAHVRSGR